MSDITPTYANILSSLAVKGATAVGGSTSVAGFVPVLNANGKLDLTLIPTDQIQASLSVTPLSSVAFVDGTRASANPDGSIAQPFPTATAAAAKGFTTLLLAAGEYSDTIINFGKISAAASTVSLIGLGPCTFTAQKLVIQGLGSRASTVILQDLTAQHEVIILGTATAVCVGRTSIPILTGSTDDAADPTAGSTLSLSLGPLAVVASTNAKTTTYLAPTDRIGNTSDVPGATATGALNRLNVRRLKVGKFTAKAGTGLVRSGTEIITYTTETASSGSDYDLYDLLEHENSLAFVLNGLFYKSGDAMNAAALTVTGATQTATLTATTQVTTPLLTLGSLGLTMDAAGYLIVANA